MRSGAGPVKGLLGPWWREPLAVAERSAATNWEHGNGFERFGVRVCQTERFAGRHDDRVTWADWTFGRAQIGHSVAAEADDDLFMVQRVRRRRSSAVERNAPDGRLASTTTGRGESSEGGRRRTRQDEATAPAALRRTSNANDGRRRFLRGEFEGKVAIVTGAAGGINRVILTRLAEDGAKCIMVDINDDWGESSAAALRGRAGTRRVLG